MKSYQRFRDLRNDFGGGSGLWGFKVDDTVTLEALTFAKLGSIETP
jgi:hypothetical protein